MGSGLNTYVKLPVSSVKTSAQRSKPETRIPTRSSARRATRSDKTTLYFNQIYARALVNNVKGTTAQAVRGGWAYNRNTASRLLFNFFNDYEYDRFQNLDLRFVLGGGAGFSALKTDRQQLALLAGFAYNRESARA